MTVKDDITAYVNTLLDGTGIEISASRLSFLVDDFIEEVTIYCNRTDLPTQLERITAKIIYAYLVSENSKSSEGEGGEETTEEEGGGEEPELSEEDLFQKELDEAYEKMKGKR